MDVVRWRLVRQFGRGVDPARPYRVETAETLSEREAMALLRELGSPYNGRLLDDRPTPRRADEPRPPPDHSWVVMGPHK